ncbi:MAG: aspartate aminotransferase family protein [Pseudobacteriovorax sp.]|nr:aspartate aminotransferase family protein [Pseudobacteriovorax sp.]
MLAPVYGKLDLQLESAKDSYIKTRDGRRILDFYGGHGVISLGHGHPQFVSELKDQLDSLLYYSNAVHLPWQDELASRINSLAETPGYSLFLCNSGAEAVENGLKVAAFNNNRKKIVAMKHAFHGRTSLALQCTDNPRLRTTLNQGIEVVFVEMNNPEAASEAITDEVAAVIIEGIQGVAGVFEADASYWQLLRKLCDDHGVCLIADEIQAGFGRSGDFFSFQESAIHPDIVCMAKGMGNGVAIGGITVSPKLSLQKGQLGTTFGGNPLAARAALTVTKIIEEDRLVQNAKTKGQNLAAHITSLPGVKAVRGRGLMIGIALDNIPAVHVRDYLLNEHQIICGTAQAADTLRLLPALSVTSEECAVFIEAMTDALSVLSNKKHG